MTTCHDNMTMTICLYDNLSRDIMTCRSIHIIQNKLINKYTLLTNQIRYTIDNRYVTNKL